MQIANLINDAVSCMDALRDKPHGEKRHEESFAYAKDRKHLARVNVTSLASLLGLFNLREGLPTVFRV